MTAEEWADFGRWFERVTAPGYRQWEEGVRRTGGCAHPVRLTGSVLLVDTATGEILHEIRGTERAPLLVPCGNRRRTWCAPCARVYQWDTWHLVKAGLVGGKGVPESVATHPRVFLTLTAPSFGAVHTASAERACRPRRGGRECDHGRALACWSAHEENAPVVGQPLCAECYDYRAAVLWNAHAGRLWHRFTDLMRRQELPRAAGVSRAAFSRTVRVAFVKVAEFQRRGSVHFHAVLRLDPRQPDESLPGWATSELLALATPRAARRVRVGPQALTWGPQTDVRPIPMADEGQSPESVAAYLAKYVTKSSENAGALDRPLYCRECRGTGLAGACHRCEGTGLHTSLAGIRVSAHMRELVATAWHLGGLPEFRHLKLRRWAHQLGYGGHFSSKSRTYSTTLTELRAARREFQAERLAKNFGAAGGLAIDTNLTYAGSGYASPTEAQIAEGIRDAIAENRALAREELAALQAHDLDPGEPE